jgi:transcriptional regulator with XRE-family HTH domain
LAGYRIDRELATLGEHVRGWRMILGLTAQQVAERAGIARDTLRKIESGDSGAGFGNVAQVLRALGILDKFVDAIDPLNSDLGRLRASSLERKRAR